MSSNYDVLIVYYFFISEQVPGIKLVFCIQMSFLLEQKIFAFTFQLLEIDCVKQCATILIILCWRDYLALKFQYEYFVQILQFL